MLLLSKKSFEKCRKNGIKTRENRISLTRWKKKKIKFCRCRSRCLFVCLQPISTIQPIQSRGSFIQFDKCEKSHFSFILSFFLEFHQLLRTSRFQISFHITRFQQSSNQKEGRNQNKFKTYFANAVEISIISTNLIKITLSQITIQKEWRLFSFCENC